MRLRPIFFAPLVLSACAAVPPIAFDLVDQQAVVHHGRLRTDEQRIDADIAGKHYEGFYLLADGTALTTASGWSARRTQFFHSVSTVRSNAGRAVLTAADGDRITCEFLFEDERAIGDCRAAGGRSYQLVATGGKP